MLEFGCISFEIFAPWENLLRPGSFWNPQLVFLDTVIPRLVSEAPSDKKLISGSIRIAPSRTVISHSKVFILGPDFCPIYCFWLVLWGGRNQQIPFVVVVLVFVCWFALGFALLCFFKTRLPFVALIVLASLELRDPPALSARIKGVFPVNHC